MVQLHICARTLKALASRLGSAGQAVSSHCGVSGTPEDGAPGRPRDRQAAAVCAAGMWQHLQHVNSRDFSLYYVYA